MTGFILATSNKGKAREIAAMFASLDSSVVTMDEAGFTGEIPEDGDTYEENALHKARTVFERTGGVVIADDSGLSVDALDGRPGVHSARYGTEDGQRMEKLLSEMKDLPADKRSARFVTAVAVVWKDGEFTVRGVCEGKIAFQRKGVNGFGYDPVFYPDGYDRTMAELDPEEKNAVSARGNAFRMAARKIAGLGFIE